MEITRDFIREQIREIKRERDNINILEDLKFSNLESSINALVLNLENAFKFNFPSMTIAPFLAARRNYNTTNDSLITERLLKGLSEEVTIFKRHLDFLKLISDRNFIGKLDRIFNRFFVYWDNNYYDNTYMQSSEPDERTKISNPILALDRIFSVFSFKVRDKLKITNSPNEIWDYNAPVVFNYNYNLNMFDLTLDNGLTCQANAFIINNCPEIDKKISFAVNNCYKETFGFDYYEFENVNKQFIDYILEILKTVLQTRYNDINNINSNKLPEHSFYETDIIYQTFYKVSFDRNKFTITFKILRPEEELNNNSNLQQITIEIDDWCNESNIENITVKMRNISQVLKFSLLNRGTSEETIVFNGYNKNVLYNNKDIETILHCYPEEYKLFVLYYGGMILAEKEKRLLELDTKITMILSEQDKKQDSEEY